MKMHPAFSSFLLMALKGIMVFFSKAAHKYQNPSNEVLLPEGILVTVLFDQMQPEHLEGAEVPAATDIDRLRGLMNSAQMRENPIR